MRIDKYVFAGYPLETCANRPEASCRHVIFEHDHRINTPIRTTQVSTMGLVPFFIERSQYYDKWHYTFYGPTLTSFDTFQTKLQRRRTSAGKKKKVLHYNNWCRSQSVALSIPLNKPIKFQDPCIPVLNIRKFRSCVSLREEW